ncbi:FHA domain-containing protein [candidate division KSB1 bacterium]|nr:FHA domain-containing protein [candidate division KSB1 bacterium]NIT73942.1 FHA domain-containing protein [candidate division KSB1 bacterium]NIX73622.1 FHA domain-containing protein [candidate division KSB1 bacterium]
MLQFGKPKSEVEITVNRGHPDEHRFTFSHSFQIGRGNSCEVQIQDAVVSGHHLQVVNENGKWWLHDLHSTNGTFMDGELINKKFLSERATVQLGKGGPLVSFKIKTNAPPQQSLFGNTLIGTIFRAIPSCTQVFNQYFSKTLPKRAGQYTMYVRNAFEQAVKRRGRRFVMALSLMTVVAGAALTTAWFQHERLEKLEPLGTEIFYNMKTLELQIAQLNEAIETSSDDSLAQELNHLQKEYLVLRDKYNHFVDELGLYDQMNETDVLILRIARIFGECELNAPRDFFTEVRKYIKRWQSTERLQVAITRSRAYGYQDSIANAFLAHNLPPQFLYLALQESDFDVNRVGPRTKYGIAKGMWQFIPRTASAYGLKLGPLRRVRRPDPKDERHDFVRSTKAAARLIRDLYNTKAQGSGLLVLASYNWGIGNLQGLLDQMPPNPKERNFWNLVKHHKIPKQTYDFVFYVVSAAVIGENPGLFGFKFKNLLKEIS